MRRKPNQAFLLLAGIIVFGASFVIAWMRGSSVLDGWLSLMIILLLAIFLVCLIFYFSPGSRRKRLRDDRTKQNLCVTCGYNLRAHHPGDRCPECGAPIPERPSSDVTT